MISWSHSRSRRTASIRSGRAGGLVGELNRIGAKLQPRVSKKSSLVPFSHHVDLTRSFPQVRLHVEHLRLPSEIAQSMAESDQGPVVDKGR
jgi:hypothetical protein